MLHTKGWELGRLGEGRTLVAHPEEVEPSYAAHGQRRAELKLPRPGNLAQSQGGAVKRQPVAAVHDGQDGQSDGADDEAPETLKCKHGKTPGTASHNAITSMAPYERVIGLTRCMRAA